MKKINDKIMKKIKKINKVENKIKKEIFPEEICALLVSVDGKEWEIASHYEGDFITTRIDNEGIQSMLNDAKTVYNEEERKDYKFKIASFNLYHMEDIEL